MVKTRPPRLFIDNGKKYIKIYKNGKYKRKYINSTNINNKNLVNIIIGKLANKGNKQKRKPIIPPPQKYSIPQIHQSPYQLYQSPNPSYPPITVNAPPINIKNNNPPITVNNPPITVNNPPITVKNNNPPITVNNPPITVSNKTPPQSTNLPSIFSAIDNLAKIRYNPPNRQYPVPPEPINPPKPPSEKREYPVPPIDSRVNEPKENKYPVPPDPVPVPPRQFYTTSELFNNLPPNQPKLNDISKTATELKNADSSKEIYNKLLELENKISLLSAPSNDVHEPKSKNNFSIDTQKLEKEINDLKVLLAKAQNNNVFTDSDGKTYTAEQIKENTKKYNELIANNEKMAKLNESLQIQMITHEKHIKYLEDNITQKQIEKDKLIQEVSEYVKFGKDITGLTDRLESVSKDLVNKQNELTSSLNSFNELNGQLKAAHKNNEILESENAAFRQHIKKIEGYANEEYKKLHDKYEKQINKFNEHVNVFIENYGKEHKEDVPNDYLEPDLPNVSYNVENDIKQKRKTKIIIMKDKPATKVEEPITEPINEGKQEEPTNEEKPINEGKQEEQESNEKKPIKYISTVDWRDKSNTTGKKVGEKYKVNTTIFYNDGTKKVISQGSKHMRLGSKTWKLYGLPTVAGTGVVTYEKKVQSGEGYINEDGLYEDQIDTMMADYKKHGYMGTFAADEIKNINPGNNDVVSFIMNLSNRNQKNGPEHWVAVFIDKKHDRSAEYYDSFADAPSKSFKKQLRELIRKMEPNTLLKLKLNYFADQDIRSGNCGAIAVNFLKHRYAGQSFKQASGYSVKKTEDMANEESGKFGYGGEPFKYI